MKRWIPSEAVCWSNMISGQLTQAFLGNISPQIIHIGCSPDYASGQVCIRVVVLEESPETIELINDSIAEFEGLLMEKIPYHVEIVVGQSYLGGAMNYVIYCAFASFESSGISDN